MLARAGVRLALTLKRLCQLLRRGQTRDALPNVPFARSYLLQGNSSSSDFGLALLYDIRQSCVYNALHACRAPSCFKRARRWCRFGFWHWQDCSSSASPCTWMKVPSSRRAPARAARKAALYRWRNKRALRVDEISMLSAVIVFAGRSSCTRPGARFFPALGRSRLRSQWRLPTASAREGDLLSPPNLTAAQVQEWTDAKG